MDADLYQEKAGRSMVNPAGRVLAGQDLELVLAALRLCVASGAVADIVKKGVLHGHGMDWASFGNEYRRVQAEAASVLLAACYDAKPAQPREPLEGDEYLRAFMALGLAGESAELVEALVFGTNGEALDEAGDTTWYIAGGLRVLGIRFGDALRRNIAKLEARYPSGFSKEASIARVDRGTGGGATPQPIEAGTGGERCEWCNQQPRRGMPQPPVRAHIRLDGATDDEVARLLPTLPGWLAAVQVDPLPERFTTDGSRSISVVRRDVTMDQYRAEADAWMDRERSASRVPDDPPAPVWPWTPPLVGGACHWLVVEFPGGEVAPTQASYWQLTDGHDREWVQVYGGDVIPNESVKVIGPPVTPPPGWREAWAAIDREAPG